MWEQFQAYQSELLSALGGLLLGGTGLSGYRKFFVRPTIASLSERCTSLLQDATELGIDPVKGDDFRNDTFGQFRQMCDEKQQVFGGKK